MRLGNRNNRLNYRSEGTPPKIFRFIRRKISFIIYYIILFAVLYSVGRTIWYKMGYINGDGMLLFDSWRIRADRDIYLFKSLVSEGDFIDYNDTISWWVAVDDDEVASRGGGGYSSSIAAFERKKLSLSQSQIERRAELEEAYRNRSSLRRELKRNLNLLSLELKPERGVSKIRSELERLNNRIQRLEQLVSNLQAKSSSLDTLKPIPRPFQRQTVRSKDTIGVYTAPVFGEISRVFALPGEYLEEGEEIFWLTSTQNMRIISYFDLKYIKEVRKGRTVYISLPDGTTEKGVIRTVFTATRDLPKEFKQAYDIARPRIVTEIIPKDKSKFPDLSGMTVDVRIKR